MGFSSDAQRRAAFASMNGMSLRRRTKIKAVPKIHYVSENRFEKEEKKVMGEVILAKGAYNHKTDEIWINKDAIRSERDRLHTLYHELGHRNKHTYDEDVAEKYAQKRMKEQGISLLRPENPSNIPKEEIMAAPKNAKNYKFRIENHVVETGTRVAIAKELPDSVDMCLENVKDDRGEHVVVHVKGRESDVEAYHERLLELKEEKRLGKAENVEISKIQEDTKREIDTNRTFNKLECEQMSTFVDSSLELRDETKAMHQDMMNVLPERIAKAMKSS